jgi:hypothetical protein
MKRVIRDARGIIPISFSINDSGFHPYKCKNADAFELGNMITIVDASADLCLWCFTDTLKCYGTARSKLGKRYVSGEIRNKTTIILYGIDFLDFFIELE